MQGIEVSLAEMLECRERRAALQDKFLAQYSCPLISFSMNVPGPIKTNDALRAAFELGKTALLAALARQGFEVNAREEAHGATGDEMLLSVDAPAEKLKALTTRIEESYPIGRLYDMDVLGTDGLKLSRPSFRKCLICERQAQECARSRAHSVTEMQAAVERLLLEMFKAE